MFNTLLPDAVLVSRAEAWMWDTPLCSDEEAIIARAVSRRQREFRAGRHCAHALLSRLGCASAPLLPGKQRQPQWPTGVTGSITHTGEQCYVAISRHPDVIGIGIDVEQREPLDHEVRHLILTPREQTMLNQLRPRPAYDPGKVIFSAKECIHKVYYPLNSHTLDFLDAEITLQPSDRTFTARIVQPAPRPQVDVIALQGRYHVTDELVYTAIVLRKERLS